MTIEPRVSAVIPTWNRADLLEAVLADLEKQDFRPSRIIVVDNGSTDGSAELAERAGAHVIRFSRNKGFAAAVNRGIAECASEWVLILNNDVSFGPEWLGILLDAAAESAWFVAGKLVRDRNPSVLDGGYDAICRGGTAWRCGEGRPDGGPWNQRRAIQFAPFTALLARRALFERVGGLDETFESYLEDADFGLRCAAVGLQGVYAPEAVARHAGSATLGAWHKATVQRIARNQIFLIRKHFAGAPRWPILAAQLLWGMTALRHGAGLAWVRGKWEGLFAEVARGVPWPAIREAVAASEGDILQLQRETGFDLYWKWYFALVRG